MENRTDITAEAENFELTEKVKKLLPKEESLFSLADFFKVFGDSTRIRILYTLFESEMCVNDIACTLEMTVSAVSHQLKVLRQARLISARREGKSFMAPGILIKERTRVICSVMVNGTSSIVKESFRESHFFSVSRRS